MRIPVTKVLPGQMNDNIHDKEMAAIIQAFKEWEPLLKSCQ